MKIFMLVQNLLPEQGLLETREQWQAILKFFGDDEIAPKLDTMWATQNSNSGRDLNTSRWNDLQQELGKVSKVANLASLSGFQALPDTGNEANDSAR